MAVARKPSGTGGASAGAERTTAPSPRADFDSRAWIARLRGAGREREDALRELHALLVGAARFALAGRGFEHGREGREDIAVQAADDALLAVLAHLDDYRGESRFTTWAWKFAFYEACVAMRKRRWLGREVPVETDGWERLAEEAGPEGKVEQAELLAALQRGVEEALTPHQRRVFVTLALNQVPVDVLAERLGTTRGALYKTLHEARARLRGHLSACGLLPEGWQAEVSAAPRSPSRRRRRAGERGRGRRSRA